LLKHLSQLQPLLWLCVGDFNEILANSEKQGVIPKALVKMEAFRTIVEDSNLLDLGYKGLTFTWSNGRPGT
jgi:hypothetical protein